MSKLGKKSAHIFQYNFDIVINRRVEDVWPQLFGGIDAWWPKEYRALGENSQMSFGEAVGSLLLETGEKGEALEWYRTQMIVPGQSLYLVGSLAPDWGGPTTSMLKLMFNNTDSSCVLNVSDALLGNVSEASAKSAESGWVDIFESGFKDFVEGG